MAEFGQPQPIGDVPPTYSIPQVGPEHFAPFPLIGSDLAKSITEQMTNNKQHTTIQIPSPSLHKDSHKDSLASGSKNHNSNDSHSSKPKPKPESKMPKEIISQARKLLVELKKASEPQLSNQMRFASPLTGSQALLYPSDAPQTSPTNIGVQQNLQALAFSLQQMMGLVATTNHLQQQVDHLNSALSGSKLQNNRLRRIASSLERLINKNSPDKTELGKFLIAAEEDSENSD